MSRLAVDTSVVVPALLASHSDHERCRAAAVGAAVPAHVMIETYSVLTRLPSPHRVDASVAGDLLSRWFSADDVLAVPAALQRAMVSRLHRAGVDAGAVFDGMVGLTAAAHDAELLTRDVRATRTYDAVGVAHRVMDR